ncbi:hypothetical protein BDZ45DRAFT_669190 [Acephala macrosclerotiorum]|nr:hypothetical protein BDZ45DRAFT_669190 [Acephala macrosclerotiorum]
MDYSSSEGEPRVSTDSAQNVRSAPRDATLLGAFDVFSLIVNKMIGTGIYTAPTTVLLLTGNAQLSLGLWAVGFFYTIMSMIIYLDYAAVFPYTGGEIVYIDEISSTNSSHTLSVSTRTAADAQDPPRGFNRIFGDGLLAYTCYAFLFIGVFNSTTNIMQIGRETLIAISPDGNPNLNLLRFIGIFALMIICLIQLFSSRAGRALNKFLALVKITFLIVLFFFGCAYISKHGAQAHFTEKVPNLPAFGYAQALLVVLYSYDGWENATFVAGEISTENPGTLRKGFIWAVAVVGILYMALNVVFLAAISYDDLAKLRDQNLPYNYAAMFSSNTLSAQRGWATIIAISSAGNANTVMYTFTRVKQSIGRMNILPWSSLWKSDYEPHRDRNGDQHKTPLGGILLEFVMSIVLICISAAVPSETQSVSLPGNIQTIAHCFILIILGLGLFRLHSRERDLNVTVVRSWFPRVSAWGMTKWGRIPQVLFILLYAGMNSFIFIATGLSKTDGVDSNYSFDGKWYPTIVLSIVALGMLYHFSVFAAYVPGPLYKKSWLQLGNVTCEIKKQASFEMEDERTRRFGHRRSVAINLTELRPKWKAALFWCFGGTLDDSPLDALENRWTLLKQSSNTMFYAFKVRFGLRRRLSRVSDQGWGSREESEGGGSRPMELNERG